MSNIFDKFNQEFGGDKLAKEVEEINQNGNTGDYEEVPFGTYEVSIEKLELVASKKMKPMLSCWFNVLAGQQTNRKIFMNQLLDSAFKIHIANNFLKSLDTTVEVSFDGDYNHYADMISEVFNDITVCGLEYQLKYDQDKKGFNVYKIEEVFETK